MLEQSVNFIILICLAPIRVFRKYPVTVDGLWHLFLL